MEQLNTQAEQPQQSSNILVYTLISIIVILLIYIGYIYKTKVVLSQDKLDEQYIKKESVVFDNLPTYIQNEYVLKSQYDYKVNEYEAEISNFTNKVKLEDTITTPKVVEKIIEVEKVVEVPKVDAINTAIPSRTQGVEAQKTIEAKEHFETYTCKTLKSGSEYITLKCKNDLKNFIEKHKDAKRFEVIGLVDKQEFKLIEKLEDVYGKVRLGNLAKYSQTGLSRQRVIEATWIIKKYIPKNISVDTVNYTVTGKNKRGFVVRAYK